MLTPELELCEVSPTCGADVHKGVCPRNPANQVRHSIGPVGEPEGVGDDAYELGYIEGYEKGLLDPGSAWMAPRARLIAERDRARDVAVALDQELRTILGERP